jgi:exopolysaccharide biosynthesis predicted pyruvyltransferase EpsI
MALLLGVPHILLNDAGAKVYNFYETWTHSAKHVQWADSPDEALRMAQAIYQ